MHSLCKRVRGEKVAMITHILGSVVRTNLACIHASAEAKEAADTLRLITNAEVLQTRSAQLFKKT